MLLESNRPGVMQRLGPDYEQVRAVNPGIVYASVAGVYPSQAVLGALFQRLRTGVGQYLDVSLMHCITAMQAYKYAEHQATGGAPRRELFAVIGLYRTADGCLALSAMREQQVLDLIGLTGLAGILEDERFASPAARFQNQDALRPLIAERLAERPTAHWLPLMQKIDPICQEVLTYDAYRKDPQVLASRLFRDVSLGAAGLLTSVRMPGLRPEEVSSASPPTVGQHTVQVLRDSGFADAEIETVLKSGVARQSADA